MQFLYAKLLSDSACPQHMITLVVDCNDRPGLTREIDGLLSELDVELESIESHRYQVFRPWGHRVFIKVHPNNS